MWSYIVHMLNVFERPHNSTFVKKIHKKGLYLPHWHGDTCEANCSSPEILLGNKNYYLVLLSPPGNPHDSDNYTMTGV